MRKPGPVTKRIERMTKVDDHGCWIWQGAPTNAGYGAMTIAQGRKPAHRVSYETYVGPIPDGLVIDHLCRVRMCVNPAHLEAVTQRENVMRSPIAIGALNAAKTHCPQGHEYTPENTTVFRKLPNTTGRRCKTCIKRRDSRRYLASKRAALIQDEMQGKAS